MSLVYSKDGNNLFIGSKEDAKNLEKLQQRNVTHILNVTPPKQSAIKVNNPSLFSFAFAHKTLAVYSLTLKYNSSLAN
jgi:hypothetical protein